MNEATHTSSERSCVVCRTPRDDGQLLPLTWSGGLVIAPKGGRRAWVCLSRDCLGGLESSHLARALKTPVGSVDAAELMLRAHQLSEQKILESIGFARRNGELEVSESALGRCVPVLVAADVAERTARYAKKAGAVEIGTTETLGRASGMGRVGVLGFREGRIAAQAAYWLQVWHVTAPRPEVA